MPLFFSSSIQSDEDVVHGLEGRRRAVEERRLVDLGADGRVRADEHALVVLDADLLVPDGDLDGDVPLLPLARRRGPGAVGGEGADGQGVALLLDDDRRDLLDEVGGGVGDDGRTAAGGGRPPPAP